MSTELEPNSQSQQHTTTQEGFTEMQDIPMTPTSPSGDKDNKHLIFRNSEEELAHTEKEHVKEGFVIKSREVTSTKDDDHLTTTKVVKMVLTRPQDGTTKTITETRKTLPDGSATVTTQIQTTQPIKTQDTTWTTTSPGYVLCCDIL